MHQACVVVVADGQAASNWAAADCCCACRSSCHTTAKARLLFRPIATHMKGWYCAEITCRLMTQQLPSVSYVAGACGYGPFLLQVGPSSEACCSHANGVLSSCHCCILSRLLAPVASVIQASLSSFSLSFLAVFVMHSSASHVLATLLFTPFGRPCQRRFACTGCTSSILPTPTQHIRTRVVM
jgi:hypothetical protein